MQHEYRLLALIATPKLADKAADLFLGNEIPIQYRLKAVGTASSEIMDTLGLGSPDKALLLCSAPKSIANALLEQLHTKLRLDAVNSGIAFTIPLSGVSRLLLRMMDQTAGNGGKDDDIMKDSKHTLIAAIVDRGFSGEVMDAAKAAGAGGGTVLHSRSIGSEEATSFFGLSIHQEKEIVLILATHENKLAIMGSISESCGMQSKAKGLVLSLPIDSVMGL